MLNRVVLVGRMTRDPELRRIQNGNAVTSFTLAMNRNFGDKQTDYINCVVWNKIAENVEKYCSKGSLVGVEGRLQSRTYDAQDGSRRTAVEVVCDSVQFLDTRKQDAQDNQPKFEETRKDINQDFDDFRSEQTFDIQDDDLQF